ncbi:MAG: hypothetical protein ACOCZB_05315 [Spirochaetota bacterium]
MTVRRPATVAIIAAGVVLTGCAPDVAFIGDPVLEAVVDPDRFEASIDAAVTETGARSRVIWPAVSSLEALDPQAVVASADASTIGLSPYLSLFAASIAERFPKRTFVAFSAGPTAGNLTRVEFDASVAMREAGEFLAEWVFEASPRSASVLLDAGRPVLAEEARSLARGYRSVAGVDLEVVRFAEAPTREDLRARLDALPVTGQVALVALLGEATPELFELTRDEPILLAGRNLSDRGEEDRILFVVRDDLARGLAAAIGSADETVVVQATFEAARRPRSVE